jgi:hypothetical protein
MWQEARKQEKAIRGMMIDFQKRAERRKAYYQRMLVIWFLSFFHCGDWLL